MANLSWLLVAVVYASCAWVGMRAGAKLRWAVVVLFYAVVLLFLRAPLTQPVVNLPADFLRILPPWSGMTSDASVANRETNDIVLQIVPWAHQVRESWRALEIPLWNGSAGSGYPLLANGQSAAFSPLRLLSLPLPLGFSFAAEAAMKILLALTCTFLFCRQRGYGETASVLGALCFGFCSFVIVWLHFPLATVAVLLPAALLAADLLVERPTRRRFVYAVIVWTAILLGGHPETAAHILFAVVVYTAWLRPRPAAVLAIGASVGIAAMLSAPFLLPFVEAMLRSKRFDELRLAPNIIPRSDFRSFIVLLQPRFFGTLGAEKPWGPATPDSITGFAGILGVAAWVTLLLSSIRARRWRSPELFFVIATVLAIGVVLGWPGLSDAFHLIFGIAANARLRLMLAFLLAVMTAGAFDLLLRDRANRGFYLTGLVAAAALLLFSVQFQGSSNPFRFAASLAAVLPSGLVLLTAVLVAFMPNVAIRVSLLCAAVLFELWTATRGWNPNVDARLLYPRTPLIDRLQHLGPTHTANAPFRIAGLGPAFFPNVAAIYGFEDVRAHDPMANARYLGVLRVASGYDTSDYFAQWRDVRSGTFDFLNVRYVITAPGADPGDPSRFRLRYEGRDGRIFENAAVLPRFFATGNVVIASNERELIERLRSHDDWRNTAIVERAISARSGQRPATGHASVTIVKASRTEYVLRVEAAEETLVVSSIPWWPGWRVRNSGRAVPIHRVNGAFLGFAAPRGTSELRVAYVPGSFWLGVAMALIAASALTFAAVLKRPAAQEGVDRVL